MKFSFLTKNAPSIFFLSASVLILILILKQFAFFDWVFSLVSALSPLWIGIVLAFFLQPLISNGKSCSKKRIIFFYVGFVIIVILLFGSLIYLTVKNLDEIIELIQATVFQLIAYAQSINLTSSIDMKQLQTWMVKITEEMIPFFRNSLHLMTTMILSIMIAFFITMEHDLIKNEFMKYVKNHEKVFHYYAIFSKILRQYMTSTLFDMVYIIFSTAFILYLFKTPFALILAILLAFFNLFPYVGALIGSGLIVLFHFVFVHEHTLWLILVIFLNSQLESNIIHTWICNKTMKVHPLFLFAALLIFDFFFGLLGVILSPIFAGILQLSFTAYGEYLNEKNIGGWEKLDK